VDGVRGLGTLVNVATVLVGSGIGVLVGHRLPQRTRDVVTDGLGLVTLSSPRCRRWQSAIPS